MTGNMAKSQRDSGHWDVYKTSRQNSMIMFFYSLALQLWGLLTFIEYLEDWIDYNPFTPFFLTITNNLFSPYNKLQAK